MAMNTEEIAIIEKVKKLLSLAANNPSEAEALAASNKAMELLEAYNLDMHSLNSARQDGTRDDKKLKGGLYSWQRDLWEAVARLNFCMYWSIRGLKRGTNYEHRVLGRRENVIGAEVMAGYLQQATERLGQQYAKDIGANSVFVRAAIAYREGVAQRLVERLGQLRRDRLAEEKRKSDEYAAAHEGSGGQALVLASVINTEYDLNCDHLYGYAPGTSARQRAERELRQHNAKIAADAELAKRDALEAANPALRVARLAAEKAAYDKWCADYDRKYGSKRPRKMTSREERQNSDAFSDGYADGADIGLDQQIDHSKRRAIQ